MTAAERKEANRYYWIVKGQLIPESWPDREVRSVLNSYFDRIWGTMRMLYMKMVLKLRGMHA